MAGEPVLFIVNPASGGGKTAHDWKAIESWLPSTGLKFETAFTTRPMEAVDNGFFHNGAPIPTTSRLAMVPLGTGGDFRRTLRISLDPRQAVQVVTSGVPRRLDVGCVTY